MTTMATTSESGPTLPVELYRHIAGHIDDKDDLLDLSVVSNSWRFEAERILWQTVVLTYDNADEANVGKLSYLAERTGQHVIQLELDYEETRLRAVGEEHLPPFEIAIRAIGQMRHLERIDIFCHGDMAALLFKASKISFSRIHTVKYTGSYSPPLYSFLHACNNLKSLRFSNRLEPEGDYNLLHKPWSSLQSFSGNILHVAAMLRSELLNLAELTVHLNPLTVSLKTGFEGVPPSHSIKTLGFGDHSGYPPVFHGHVLDDINDALPFFPNVKHMRRLPFLVSLNLERLISTLAKCPQLTEISVLDYDSTVSMERALEFARKIKSGACKLIERVVAIPCPPKRVAFDCTCDFDAGWRQEKIRPADDMDL